MFATTTTQKYDNLRANNGGGLAKTGIWTMAGGSEKSQRMGPYVEEIHSNYIAFYHIFHTHLTSIIIINLI
jgi:hypothetical protein